MENTNSTDKPRKLWKLNKINIDYQKYGDHKGHYIGRIEFENEEGESFKFNIYPEMAAKYLNLMVDDLRRGVNNLTEDLMNTLPITQTKKQ